MYWSNGLSDKAVSLLIEPCRQIFPQCICPWSQLSLSGKHLALRAHRPRDSSDKSYYECSVQVHHEVCTAYFCRILLHNLTKHLTIFRWVCYWLRQLVMRQRCSEVLQSVEWIASWFLLFLSLQMLSHVRCQESQKLFYSEMLRTEFVQ